MGAIGPTQVILIVLVVLLLFGGRKIPELMRGLGRGVKEFKDATQDDGKAGDDADKAGSADRGGVPFGWPSHSSACRPHRHKEIP
jgi:sec-independent protein translocase protein TatA